LLVIGTTMADREDLQRLESELESAKANLREDVSQVQHTLQQTRAELSPTNFIRDRLWLVSGIAFALGLLLGYRRIPLSEIAKPAARTTLSTAAKQAAMRAVRG
jgi:hypothetical protein